MSTVASDRALLEETLVRLFTDYCAPVARQAAESDGWAPTCWDQLQRAELVHLGVPEEAGGSGGAFDDACTLVRLAGRYAVPLPLAECSLVGGWLVGAAGLRLPPGPVSVALPHPGNEIVVDGGRVSGRLDRVPWGQHVAAVVAVTGPPADPRVAVLDPALASRRPGRNLAGEPRDALEWQGVPVPDDRIGGISVDQAEAATLRGALSRSLLIAGAMEAVADLTCTYAIERQQFGRPIASFQAVAHRLVRLSEEVEMVILAAEVAARRFAEAGTGAAFEVATSKVVASRAVAEVTAHAHQVHGAIGMTQEHQLHHFTRRLWAWRQEWGSERHWAEVVGRSVVDVGAAGLWPRIASGLTASSALA